MVMKMRTAQPGTWPFKIASFSVYSLNEDQEAWPTTFRPTIMCESLESRLGAKQRAAVSWMEPS